VDWLIRKYIRYFSCKFVLFSFIWTSCQIFGNILDINSFSFGPVRPANSFSAPMQLVGQFETHVLGAVWDPCSRGSLFHSFKLSPTRQTSCYPFRWQVSPAFKMWDCLNCKHPLTLFSCCACMIFRCTQGWVGGKWDETGPSKWWTPFHILPQMKFAKIWAPSPSGLSTVCIYNDLSYFGDETFKSVWKVELTSRTLGRTLLAGQLPSARDDTGLQLVCL
jgi:hypothetical protein